MFAGPLLLPGTASAETLEEMEQQQREYERQSNELDTSIQEKEENLSNLEEDKTQLEEEIKTLQGQIDEVVINLQEQEQKLEESIARVEQLQEEIEQLKQLIAQREEKLDNQARSVQTDGNATNIIGMIVSSESLSDLFARIGVINQLVTANKTIVAEQLDDQELLEISEQAAEDEKVAVETLKGEIEVTRNNLVAQKAELDDKIVQVAAQYEMTEQEKDAFVEEQQIIATQTSTLSANMQEERQRIFEEEQAKQKAAEEEEARRIAAEEEAAKAAAEEEARKAAEEEEASKVAAEKAQSSSLSGLSAAADGSDSTNNSDSGSGNSDSGNSDSGNSDSATSPPANTEPISNGSGFIRPSGGSVTSPYGYRTHPITGVRHLHGGIDFNGGGPIVAAQSGTVTVSGYHSSWGYYVKINHGNGLETLYAHMQAGSLAVTVGQQVSQGQQLGIMGSTGDSTGVHLHFEVYKGGSRVNPASYLGL